MTHHSLDGLLGELVEHGYSTGYQYAIMTADEFTANGAGLDAHGRVVDSESLFSVYCCSKPLLAAGVLSLVVPGGLSLETTVGDVFADIPSIELAATQIQALLSHRCGLWDQTAQQYWMTPKSSRLEQLLRSPVLPSAHGSASYVEYASWELLGFIIEKLTGVEAGRYVNDEVLAPLGVVENIFFPTSLTGFDPARFRVNSVRTISGLTPIHWEDSKMRLNDLHVSGGAVASMSGLAMFLWNVMCSASPSHENPLSTDIARPMATPQTELAYDHVLQRTCSYGFGTMTGLSDHDFSGRHSDASFGHTGVGSMTFCAADPSTHVSYAVHLNVVPHSSQIDDEASPTFLRREISDLILGR